MSPSPQPRYKGAYFSGLPADECQDPAAPSLLVAAVPVPGRDGPRKTRSTPERTLVLELEGTLVCSSVLAGWRQGAVATFTTVFQGDSYKVHVKLRPHVEQFLESLSKTYEVPGAPTFPWGLAGSRCGASASGREGLGQPVQGPLPAPPDLHLHNCKAGLCREGPGCAGPQEEADQVMMALVKPRWGPPMWQGLVPTGSASPSRRCLSQPDCLCARGSYWKDLTRLGRDLAKTVALDHTIQGFPTQAANWIPVQRWWGDPWDEELLHLTLLLGQLCRADDVRAEIQRRFLHRRLPTED
ncbi:CTD small phosphatase-like protein 2-A isoform X2 [Haliaeetus albicilla]|uniref:CTD small phosphatase-like protein 2-A isoform X2 n=1 Tax=Haliaeetus albicilla TaxID=8969 RepID=UPI0037E86B35